MSDLRTGPYVDPAPPPAGSGRFAPGDLLAGRYRVVAPLGKGGMGEVYRADDLTLGQPVALKFLPPHLNSDPERLARFRKEVATARRVSHPNACRVYDIGEHQGQTFLSMEYIDGEDLASLLSRVGRLSEEKGVEIARQLCAAVAAVHDQSLLHRDLKPQNVMLDGRGKVRLTDFGLAAVAAEAVDVRSGTPAYQAPEQLRGAAVSVQSDLFALGLVLYEVFTGRRAFAAQTREELAKLYQGGSGPSKPSSHVSGLNPAVERVVLRCLECDPKDRPRSAYEVLAGLPGGDLLGAALAAGETPSPQLVADAGEVGTLAVGRAALLLVLVVAGLVFLAFANDFSTLLRRIPPPQPPEELARKARQHLADLGYPERPADSDHHFRVDHEYLDYVKDHDPSPRRWDALRTGRPAAQTFFYRESPQPLDTTLVFGTGEAPGLVTPRNPPTTTPGMANVQLDGEGRLVELIVIPAAPGDAGKINAPLDWGPLLAAARLRAEELEEDEFRWVPPGPCDRRAAWKGKFPGRPDLNLHAEAAAFQGKPVFFRVGGDWTPPDGVQGKVLERGWPFAIVFFAVFASVVLLALRNLRLRRGDRRGTAILVSVCVVGMLGSWLLFGHHPGTINGEECGLVGALGWATYFGLFVGLTYLAVEPAIRRRWPWRLTAWTRALAGRLRDPLVGRDLLVGLCVGTGAELLSHSIVPALEFLGLPCPPPNSAPVGFPLPWLIIWLVPFLGIMTAMLLFALAFLFTLVLRRDSFGLGGMAVLSICLIVIFWRPSSFSEGALLTLFNGLLFALVVLVIARFGLLVVAAYFVAEGFVTSTPLTWDTSAWYFWHGLLGPVVVLALAVYGFFTATAGQKLFEKGFFGDE
jgi:serine/threonine-protein kinase